MSQPQNHIPIIAFAGGFTAGPVMPLLALRQEIMHRHFHARFVLIDVRNSVGEAVSKKQHLTFHPITSGKLRRYFSWRTLVTPFQVLTGLIQSLRFLRNHKVTHVIGAGGFAQVPVAWAAWLLRIPVHIHQQDIEQSLTNKLCWPIATTVSVTFESSLLDFPQSSGLFSSKRTGTSKIVWTGNPVRPELMHASRTEAIKFFELDKSWPTVFVVGGGSGAVGINHLIQQSLNELLRTVQIIHSTGKGKLSAHPKDGGADQEIPDHVLKRYHQYEFINRTDLAYAASEIVIARAGIGTISELSHLGKVSIIIPMPGTHQEYNATMLYNNRASIVLDQEELSADMLVRIIRKLLFDLDMQHELSKNIQAIMPQKSAAAIASLIGL